MMILVRQMTTNSEQDSGCYVSRKDLRNNFLFSLCQFSILLVTDIWLIYCALEYKSSDYELNKINPIYSHELASWVVLVFLVCSASLLKQAWLLYRKASHRKL